MKPEFQQVRFLVEKMGQTPVRFGIVTACNPDGVTVSDDENRSATERLRAYLKENALTYFEVTGCSPDLRHREPGFGVIGLQREEIVRMGQQWKQEAVFWVDEGNLHLVPCNPGEAVTLGQWDALVAG
jgi:hypothetical protein